jgi:hypothetical protein
MIHYLFHPEEEEMKMSEMDSAFLQSMQRILNTAYNQRSLQSTPLFTFHINGSGPTS